MEEKLLEDFELAAQALREAGYNVVAVATKYLKDEAFFHTCMKTFPSEEFGVDEDHVMLDAIREFIVEWSNARHNSRLDWRDNDE